MLLVNSGKRRTPGVERSSSVHTRRPSRATTRPSMVIVSRNAGPCFGMRHCNFPVSISIACAVCVTLTPGPTTGVPGARRNGPLAPVTVANPVNLIDPSGQ